MPPNDDPLVSTEWLASHLDDPNIRIIDASYKMPGAVPRPVDDYLAAHIPGAVYFDVNTIADPNNPLPHMYPKAEHFGREVSILGISSDDLVIAYDSGSWMASARAWWMFLSFGHSQVKVLDGGLQKWRREGRPLQSGPPAHEPGQFTATFDSSFIRSLSQMRDNLKSRDEQVIDARARERFEGTVSEPWPGRRAGHIPASLNLPFSELYDAQTGTMKPTAELRRLFTNEGVDLQQPVVTTCGSGVSAAVLSLALYRLGVRGSALYDGSWAEWGLPGGPPIATGPA